METRGHYKKVKVIPFLCKKILISSINNTVVNFWNSLPWKIVDCVCDSLETFKKD